MRKSFRRIIRAERNEIADDIESSHSHAHNSMNHIEGMNELDEIFNGEREPGS